MNTDEYISVSELNLYIKTYLENNYFLQDIYIKGEISNFKRHSSNTLYFAIKDEKSRVNVVMFPYYSLKMKYPLKDGDLVLIHGKLSVYEANGTYSIQATEILFDSVGMLYLEYEKLKEKLENEGLFSLEHKKKLPAYPSRIGIITAPTGAAIHDMVRTIYTRWNAQIILFPCLVQGENAASDIVRAIKIADSYHMDVLICGRGGGSIEDLWPFNEEIVARAIYNCKTPIISAVGHQNDFTIADFVSDIRALTPTDGAIKATPNKNEVLNILSIYKKKLISAINSQLEVKRKELNKYTSSYLLNNPQKIYENYRLRIDNYVTRLDNYAKKYLYELHNDIQNYKNDLSILMDNYLGNNKNKYQNLKTKLDALSPLNILKRGYIVASIDNKTIKSINDVNVNENINLKLYDGTIQAKILKKGK